MSSKRSTLIAITYYRICIFISNRIFIALIHAEKEWSRRSKWGLTPTKRHSEHTWSFRITKIPFCSSEATEDKVSSCLDDSESPSFAFTTFLEIRCSPPICTCVIYPLERSLRKFVPNKFHDHLSMSGGQKSLRSPKKDFWEMLKI
jgi:hypothetical protein